MKDKLPNTLMDFKMLPKSAKLDELTKMKESGALVIRNNKIRLTTHTIVPLLICGFCIELLARMFTDPINLAKFYIKWMYLVPTPITIILFVYMLRNFPFPRRNLSDRLFYSFAGGMMSLVFILLPMAVISFGGITVGRASVIVELFGHWGVRSIVGALLFYGVSLGAWFVLFGIPKIILNTTQAEV